MDSNRVVELDAASSHPERMEIRLWIVPRGPTALAADHDGQRLVVWSLLARSLTTLALAERSKSLALTSPSVVAKNPLAPELARGRDLFHSGDSS